MRLLFHSNYALHKKAWISSGIRLSWTDARLVLSQKLIVYRIVRTKLLISFLGLS